MKRVKNGGIPYLMLGDEANHVAHSYVTASCFDRSGGIVTARLKEQDAMECLYVRTDLKTGEERILYEDGKWPQFLVWNDKLFHYHGKELLETDIPSGITSCLWQGEYELYGIPSITQDGRYLGVSWYYEDHSTSVSIFDKNTGECREIVRKKFPAPYEWISHVMVNPADESKCFFCHEGDCCYITNRLWIADTAQKTAKLLFRQQMDSEMGNGESCGHEMWSFDGKGMYFVKYISATILPRGVWYVDQASKKAKSIAESYPYWHVGVSPDGRYLAADTQEPTGKSDIVLIDLETGEEKVLARIPITGIHPCHPHPVFSQDGTKLCFTMLGENGRLAVGIISVKDAVGKKMNLQAMNLIEKVTDRMVFGSDTDWGMDLNRFDWVPGVGLCGIFRAFEATKREDYIQYLNRWAQLHAKDAYTQKTINSTAPCIMLLGLYELTGKAEYRKVCQDMAEYILREAPRTIDGGLEHTVTERVPGLVDQMWADTLFMACIFMARAGRILGKKEYTGLAVSQLKLHYRYLFDRENGLFYHAWHGGRKDHMGGIHWGRANGWIAYSTAEILKEAGAFEGRDKILEDAKILFDTLKKYQRENGMFGTVLDDKDAYEEISASCGIAAGILRMVRFGYIGQEYREMAERTIANLPRYIAEDGTVLQVSTGTPVYQEASVYKKIPIAPTLYGQGLMVLALAEV
ncbi:MAG: oligogalacturonate lyase family protein [Eubacteriales bacterium]|nr:oligogalacturonate lyase family protein [Eubacteriales bacterium]